MVISAFGDSNTYGYDPRLGGGGRYPYDVRWTGKLGSLLNVSVKNYGHNGACIPKNADYMSAGIIADKPDAILIMYGTNDILIDSGIAPGELENRMRYLIDDLADRCGSLSDKLILVAPPHTAIGAWTDPQIVAKSREVAPIYESIAADAGIGFADASEWSPGLCFDGVHLSDEGHKAFFEGIRKAIEGKR